MKKNSLLRGAVCTAVALRRISHLLRIRPRVTNATVILIVLSISADVYAAKGGNGGPPNRRPKIEGIPPTHVQVGIPYDFTPTSSDPDGDELSFTILNQPAWASLDSSSGRLYGTPQILDLGVTTDIVITVSDGQTEASLAAFSVEVHDGSSNYAPTIGGDPSTAVTVGQNYSFTPTADDPDGDELTFSISGKPDWASFITSSGQLSGTPTDADVGTTSPITLSVSDGQSEASLSPFSIDVQSAGSAPGTATLSWTLPTQRRDGSPLTDLAGVGIAYGNASRQYDRLIRVDSAGITTYLVEDLNHGTWYFSVFVYTEEGMTSGFSNEESKEIAKSKGPGPGKGKN